MLTGCWCIEKVEVKHNHELQPDFVRLMCCLGKPPPSVRKQMEVNECVGHVRNKSISAAFTRAGRDAAALKLKGGDAAALMMYLRKQQSRCRNFWYTCDINDVGRLKNVFWADGWSRAAFNFFGDVVTFDSTYLTKRYRTPFVVFVGVNHHGQSILLGCALLANGSKETYDWVFQAFLNCMNAAPKAIIIDHCASICGAVRDVFCEARHRLCLWHVMKKLPDKLIHVDQRDEVIRAISEAVYDSKCVTEFEESWLCLMSKFELGDSRSWFSELFEIRSQWVPIFVKSFFWAGMSTMQKSESMSGFFDGYVNSRTSLKKFVEKYVVAMRCKWEKEKHEDFRCFNQRPRLVSSFGFERQFCAAYTLRMFYIFQKELRQLMACNNVLLSVDNNAKLYRVAEIPGGDYIVHFMPDSKEYRCECMMFESHGIVCRHGLCVYRDEGIHVLPDKYIISRWRKNFICNHVHEIVSYPESHRDIGCHDVWCSKLNSVILNMVEMLSRHDSFAEKIFNGLNKLSTELAGDSGLHQSMVDVSEDDSDGNTCQSLEANVGDPINVHSKGRRLRNSGMESAGDNADRKKRSKSSSEKSSGNNHTVKKSCNGQGNSLVATDVDTDGESF